MSLTLKNDGSETEFKLIEPGTYAAVCTGIFDFGPQEVEYQGEKKEQNKVRLRWEVPSERIIWKDSEGVEQEGPMTVGKTYTASMYSQATLRQHLESWRGREFTPEEEMGFDLKSVLGKPCMITVQHDSYNGKPYAKITGIGKIMKGTEVAPEGELKSFDFDTHSEAEFEALPEWMREKVSAGKALLKEQRSRVQSSHSEEPKSDFAEDDIPF